MLKRSSLFIFVFIFSFIGCSTQRHLVQKYFIGLEQQTFDNCMKSDFTIYSIKRDPSSSNKLKEDCKVPGMTYIMMKEGTIDLIESSKIKGDFVIINTITSNLTIPSSTISILKIKDNEELFIIRKNAENKTVKESYKNINPNDDFLSEKKNDIIAIENYIMKNTKNNVTEIVNKNVESNNYHVVAKVNGKYIIKELYCIEK
ncbi:hypothetical protein BCF58_1984 [Chryseobacterium defluvii]|uniref:Lipoprotein n=1 Tax=Chryseobacterium defluvii TaxID=160396 RepID=A0A495SC97_9FLAO|nr:hypothetical protein BCF58_1984 [Chryseobacterium defluvii]